MSPAEPPGQSRARVAGIGLLGVSGVALVLGVVSLFTGDTSTDAAATPTAPAESTQSTASGQPTPGPEPTTSTGSPTPTESTSSATATSTPASTPSTAPDPGQTGGATPPAQPTGGAADPVNHAVTVRVYNNGTITGLARRAADDLRAHGWQVTEVGAYSQGRIATTTVYYRPGTDEEAEAKRLGELIRARVEPRFEGIESATPGVILIITNDYQGPKK